MTRVIAYMLVAVLLAACGREEPAKPAPPSPTVAAPPAPPAEAPAPAQATPPKSPAPATAARKKERPAPGAGTYVVQRGDTLQAIAKKHGVDYRELAKWNNLRDPGRIRAGQELRLTPPGK